MGHITTGIPEGTITTHDIMRETGIGLVQLHRWVHNGIIPGATIYRGRTKPILKEGQGTVRVYLPKWVPIIKLLLAMQRQLGQAIPASFMKEIVRRYSEGKIELQGFTITWTPETQGEQDGSS